MRFSILMLALVLPWLGACGRTPGDDAHSPNADGDVGRAPTKDLARRMVLAPHAGDTDLDRRIVDLQARVAASRRPAPLLQNLGWSFVTKARRTHDAGFYKLAEQCAALMATDDPHGADLLRGHALHAMHRFAEAEAVARRLVAARGGAFDHGLLGDVHLDRGDLDAALAAYQRMLDLKPCLQSYARAGCARWLRGDVEGAKALLSLAIGAGSRRDPESLLWAVTRLGDVALDAGDLPLARRMVERARTIDDTAATALLLEGRYLCATGDVTRAIPFLRRAAEANPLPSYRWALADALRAAGRDARADAVEAAILRDGATEDTRGFALFLASRGTRAEEALALARRELAERRDVFTLDLLAWAQHANGLDRAALDTVGEIMRRGTRSARLAYHAGVIAARAGAAARAKTWLRDAKAMGTALSPIERRHVERVLARL